MPPFAANLSMMYVELPFLDRFEAAAKDGFTAVECQFPYAFKTTELTGRLKDNGLQQVLFNAPPGGTDAASIAKAWEAGGSRGTACVPGREAEFKAGVALALTYAEALNCPRIHLMAGLIPPGLQREDVQPTYVANLRWAANTLTTNGLTSAYDVTVVAVHDGTRAGVVSRAGVRPDDVASLLSATSLGRLDLVRVPRAAEAAAPVEPVVSGAPTTEGGG